MRRHTLRQPDVAADHAVVADDRIAAEDGGAGVDHDAIFDRGVAFGLGQVFTHAQGAEGDALIDLDVVADVDRFADDETGAVVDAKILSDRGTWVDIDPGLAVRVFGQNTGDQRHLQALQFVRDPVYGNGEKARIGADHLGLAGSRGVAAGDRFGIFQ